MSTQQPQTTAAQEEGVTKQIVYEGDKKTFPKKGDVVTVIYEGKLTNGKIFDTTQVRGPFITEIGVYKLIKGWDDWVPRMSLGERCILTIPPSHAYGERGFPPDVIPANAALIFTMELIGINANIIEPKGGLYTQQAPPALAQPVLTNGSHIPEANK